MRGAVVNLVARRACPHSCGQQVVHGGRLSPRPCNRGESPGAAPGRESWRGRQMPGGSRARPGMRAIAPALAGPQGRPNSLPSHFPTRGSAGQKKRPRGAAASQLSLTFGVLFLFLKADDDRGQLASLSPCRIERWCTQPDLHFLRCFPIPCGLTEGCSC